MAGKACSGEVWESARQEFEAATRPQERSCTRERSETRPKGRAQDVRGSIRSHPWPWHLISLNMTRTSKQELKMHAQAKPERPKGEGHGWPEFYSPQMRPQGHGKSEFSLSRIPTAQTPWPRPYSPRSTCTIGMSDACRAGKRPPMNPSASAHTTPSTMRSAVTAKSNATWLKED